MSQPAFLADIRTRFPVLDPDGFVIHGAIHEAKPDVACIIHTPSLASVAFSVLDASMLEWPAMHRVADRLYPSCKN